MSLHNPLSIPLCPKTAGSITVPGSKSISNRVLLIAALAQGKSSIHNILDAIDTQVMLKALQQLGCQVEQQSTSLQFTGLSGCFQPTNQEVYIENAGTAARFLTVALLLGEKQYILTGNQRMQERPIHDLVNVLLQQKVQITYLQQTGFLPIQIKAQQFKGGCIEISGQLSSQYISALMITAPYAQSNTTIKIQPPIVSLPYIDLTISTMESFGAEVIRKKNEIFISNQSQYKAQNYTIESDASSASYFFAFAAITQSTITVKNISQLSYQGDIQFVELLKQMGCDVEYQESQITVTGKTLNAISVDMNQISDVAPTLAVVAVFAKGKTEIKNVENMRIKECDRIKALVVELSKLNLKVEEFQDGLTITGQSYTQGATFNTYDDHRMAMSLALLGLKIPDIHIHNPSCVEKTFPHFFKKLFQLYT